MKFFILLIERAAKLVRMPFYGFLISFLVPDLLQFRDVYYHSKSSQEGFQNQQNLCHHVMDMLKE